jgi:conjugative transfer region protein TrbK
MNVRVLIRGVAYLVFALALLATAISLNNRQDPLADALQVQPSTSTESLDAELAHCRVLGVEAASDAACKAAWQANRERFLNSKKFYPDYVTDRGRAASNPNESTPVLGGRWPRSAPAPVDRAGQPQ